MFGTQEFRREKQMECQTRFSCQYNHKLTILEEHGWENILGYWRLDIRDDERTGVATRDVDGAIGLNDEGVHGCEEDAAVTEQL